MMMWLAQIYPVQRRQALSGFDFLRHEPHRRSACRLADGFGIDEVVLVALDEGADELRGISSTWWP
jgi:hypothetical protein